MRILVTGASGFIGSNLIDKLLKGGHQVIATSSNLSSANKQGWFKQVEYIEYKITEKEDNSNLFELFSNPDIIIHLAWEGLPNYTNFSHIQKNLVPQYFFLKNLIKHGCKSIVITGTCFEYGFQSGCLSETDPTFPSNYYAIAKDTLRRLLEILTNESNVEFKWIRLFYMYGNNQPATSLISQLEKAIKNNEQIFNMSLGEQIRDYLPVETVINNIEKIALQKKYNGIFNCSSNRPISIKKFVQNYIEEKKASIELNLGYYPYPTYEPLAFWGDNSKLNKVLNENS